MSPQRIADPDVQLLAGIGGTIESDFPLNPEWDSSPFGWIKHRPSRQVGKIGEMLVAGWLAAKNYTVGPSPDSDADRIVNNKRVEVKLSTKWKSNKYKFQQLRDQRYDFVVCLGICPFDAHCWAIPKSVILDGWKNNNKEGITGQHAEGQETAWLEVPIDNPPDWLRRYGGRLSEAEASIRRLVS